MFELKWSYLSGQVYGLAKCILVKFPAAWFICIALKYASFGVRLSSVVWGRSPAPDLLWVSDFSYMSTWQSLVYVTFMIDIFANRIVE